MLTRQSWLGALVLVLGPIGCEGPFGGDDSDVGDGDGDDADERDLAEGDGDNGWTAPGGDGDAGTSGGDGVVGGDIDGAGDGDQERDGDGAVAPPPPPSGSSASSDEAPGNAEGDFAENFTLMDQHGTMVSLSDYCGQVVYIPIGAMWCPGCQASAELIPDKMAEYGADGFVVLNLMAETSRGDDPDQEALTAWADTYNITTPVLADLDWGVWERYWPDHSTPKNLLIDREGRLAVVGWVGSRDIENAL